MFLANIFPNNVIFMLNLVYHKSAQSRCYHPFHPALDVTRSMAARMLVFHPILKCFQSLKFSRPNKPQSCNISFIILKGPLFPIFFHLAVVLATSLLQWLLLLLLFFLLSLLLLFLHSKVLLVMFLSARAYHQAHNLLFCLHL